MTPASVTMAVSRDSLNKTLAGLIDLEDSKNHAWFIKRLTKLCNQQGCEVPEISALCWATPITDIDKRTSQNNGTDTPENSKQFDDNIKKTPEEIEEERLLKLELDKAAQEIADTQRRADRAKADDSVYKAELSQLKLLEQKKELIQINPLARLLFYITSSQRTQLINMMSNLSQIILDDIKTALINDLPKEQRLTDAEIRVKMQERWLDDLSKIFKNTDLELKNKIRQIKKKSDISETEIKSQE